MIEKSPSKQQFSEQTFISGNIRSSLNGAQIGADTNINLFNGEFWVLGAIPDITSCDHIYCPSYNRTMYSNYNGDSAVLKTIERFLESQNSIINLNWFSGCIGTFIDGE